MWGRLLALGQPGPSRYHQKALLRPIVVLVPETHGRSLANTPLFRCHATPARPSAAKRRPKPGKIPLAPAPAPNSAPKLAPNFEFPPASRTRNPLGPPSIQPKPTRLSPRPAPVAALQPPPARSDWPWKHVQTSNNGTQEWSRVIFARPHYDTSPQLPLWSGVFVCGVIVVFASLAQTSGDLEPEAKERLHARFGTTFDNGLPIWFFPSIAGFIAMLPLLMLYVQGRSVVRLSQVLYLPADGTPAQTVLRMKTPNHMIKIPFTKHYPYPKPRDIDPSKCTIRWSYRGTEEVELNLRTRDTRLTQNYLLLFTPTKKLQKDIGEDVVLSVQRLEEVFGRPDEPESQYHTTPSLTHRILEYLTPYREKAERT